MRILSFVACCLSLLFVGCFKESFSLEESSPTTVTENSTIPFPGVEEALWVYFERFEEEAAKRGITVDLRSQKILGEINEIDDDGVAGTCHYDSRKPNEVTIDRGFWESANDLYREIVVFHELGHCELVRDHREAQNAAGTCLSIMASGVGNCRLQYRANTRTAYLNELFNVNFAGDWFN